MYFKYCEELNRKCNNKPWIFINSDNNDFDTKRTHKISLIDFIDGLPVDALNELNKILKFSDNFFPMYINKETWIRFQIAYKIKIVPIGKELKRAIIGNGELKSNKNIDIKYTENKKEKELTFKKENLFVKGTNLNLFESSENTYSSYDVIIHKDAICSDFKQMLYVFLECLFTSKINYYLKKCEYCGKFYIANKSDNQYCQRTQNLNGINVSCNKVVANLQKTYTYKQLMKSDKYFMNNLNTKDNLSTEYIKEYKNAKKEAKKQYFRDKDFDKLEKFIKDYKINNPYYEEDLTKL